MSNEEIYAKLNEIFRDIFMDDSIEVTPDTTANDIEDWDSLMHITLIAEVESVFGVKFGAERAARMKNAGEMVEVIKGLMG